MFSTDVRNFSFCLLDSFSKVSTYLHIHIYTFEKVLKFFFFEKFQIGTAIAPFIVYLKNVTNMKGLPPAIFGSLMIFGSIFLFFTPETKDITLAQTVDELKNSGNPSIYGQLKNKMKKIESSRN